MLTARPWRFQNRKIGLALLASPSFGSPWANRLDLLISYFKNEQGKNLQWGNWSLRDLDDRFRLMLEEKAIPQLAGQEACENHFVVHAKWLPPAEAVVPKDSAGRYFGRVVMLPGTDHFTCVKPDRRDHPAYLFLRDFCGQVEQAAASQAPGAASATTPPVSHPVETAPRQEPVCCQGVHWDVAIDEEGDAYNEMGYRGIALPTDSPLILPLPPAEVQSGHCTAFELVRDARTSEGVTLDQPAGESVFRRIEIKVVFENRPTAIHPANFCLSSYDWNAYSMNMEEYRQKPGWREDGMDYVEKAVPGSWNVLTLLIRYPNEMVFAKDPFLEVYDYSKGREEREDSLTADLQDCFHYSKSHKTAMLLVRQPPPAFSYRISWLLGESGASVTSSLLPKQRQRQRAFARKLLRMRKTGGELPSAVPTPPGGTASGLETEEASAQALRTGVNSVLASVAQFVAENLGERELLDTSAFELSLMVLDDEQTEEPAPEARKFPVLRIVAGTHLQDPGYRDLILFAGDGNAGRAWKRRMARVFDRNEKDPKRHIYVPVSARLHHQFLVSIPLIDPESAGLVYGILNIGTFSASQADILRPLGCKDEMEKLTGYAQAFVLKRLLECLKM
jgi:hypothetical protein